jgi:hypothetical protein
MPTIKPPRNVSGMLANMPIAAAPNACTTRNVSVIGSSPMNGTIKTPDSAARVDPKIQEMRRTLVGLVPWRSSRSGSSTTARIDVPSRVKRNSA